ncbi:MAG: hypothetical protein JWP12_159 [Bacteroidetes bacterium]|nr:hypothetical protein [Bacteroidota bacterium]
MYLHPISKQVLLLKKGIEVPLDLKDKMTQPLSALYLRIEHPLEHSISLLFIFENKNGSVFRYPKNFIISGQPLIFNDNNYRFEGPIKSIKIVSEINLEITVN